MTSHKRILFTDFEGGVGITEVAPFAFQILSHGGFWDGMPRGFADRQLDRFIKDGVHPDHARRYVNAVISGGCTTAEVYDIIKDKDCVRLGTLHELVHIDELPTDRWFRDAWSRSANGGPVGIDIVKARVIQWKKLMRSVERENKRRRDEFDALPEIRFNRDSMRTAMRHARDDEELRRVWIDGLERPDIKGELNVRSGNEAGRGTPGSHQGGGPRS